MAVDTRDERFSLIGMALPFGRTLHTPDGTIGADDRQFFLLLYVGILWSEAVTPEVEVAIRVSGGPERERRKRKKRRPPEDRWYDRVLERTEIEKRRRGRASATHEKVIERAARKADLSQTEKIVTAKIKAWKEEEEAAARRAAEKQIREDKLLRQRLLNLEKAIAAKEKKRKLAEEKRQRQLKSLKKARASKKRKRKKKGG